ncbi:MAG: bifunctional DNA-formamidopyrimidine glycosylase/DNA-(apurinic or apyrimidinic site) lyase [Candidatus Magasanikiibacteriota bacterium]
MPELPEVETIRQDLRKKILHKKIKNIEITQKARVNMNHSDFVKSLKNKEFVEIDRIGKLIIFGLANKKYLLVHLKMTGQLIYERGRQMIGGGHSENQMPVNLPDKFTRATFEFTDSGKLYFNDMRRFGYLKIVNEKELQIEKAKYGIEPLQINFTLINFKQALQNRKTSIKAVLLNQKLIAGVGNIYADESCFLAGIRPNIGVDKLTSLQVSKLYKAIEKVIKQAIKKRGTTFNHFRDSDGNTGNFVKYLKVYGRAGEKCKKCGLKLKKLRVAGRGTVYCANCQR